MASYPLGQPVRLSTTVTDPVTSLPVDPGAISLVMQKPDLTTQTLTTATTPPVVRDSVGTFHLDFTGTLGHYGYYWLTTGSAAGATRAQSFDVTDPFTPTHVAFDDAKKRLNVSTLTDDEIQDMIASAVSEQEQRVGPVAPRVVVETVTASGGRLALSTRPVLSLTSALLGVASTSITGWSVPSAMAGLVESSAAYLTGTYTVTYVAGRNPVPQDLVEAALLRVLHSYGTQRGGSGGGQIIGSASTDSETGVDSSDFLLMLRARDKEAPYVLPVIA